MSMEYLYRWPADKRRFMEAACKAFIETEFPPKLRVKKAGFGVSIDKHTVERWLRLAHDDTQSPFGFYICAEALWRVDHGMAVNIRSMERIRNREKQTPEAIAAINALLKEFNKK